MHAKPAYRPGARRRIAHAAELTGLMLRTGLLFSGHPSRTPRQLRVLRRWGTTLAGLTVANAVRDPDDVRAHVRAQVARYAVPRDVHFVAELPRNATGKVVHRWLDPARPRHVRSEGQVSWPHTAS